MNIQNMDIMLESMIDTIVKSVSPQKIILFGSYATGTANKNSDIDLLIIEKQPFGASRSRRKEAAKIWQALMQFPLPKDILVYSTAEIESLKLVPNHIVSQAIKKGRVLYELAS